MSESIVEFEPEAPVFLQPGTRNRWARRLVLGRLDALEQGCLTLVDGPQRACFGNPASELRARIEVRDPRFYRALVLGGPLGGAEAYMDGYWYSDDLASVIRILALNGDVLRAMGGGIARIVRPALALRHALRRNSKRGSRRNIAAHYDLGNDFFELFLDPTLTYSSGIFERPDATMEEASIAKNDRICRKLELGPEDHVLEIGTGWGGFAMHAAGRYGCRVTTTTISKEQHELASRRVAEAGLGHLVNILFQDYRELEGEYDKLVSIEMIEAVGHDHLESFLRVCGDRLRPKGAMLIQGITIGDRYYQENVRSVDFIKRYIFPGGQLVSVGAVNEAASATGDLRMTHLEDITPHYAETLRRWRAKMNRNLGRIRALGLPERFVRMWEFYLCYCEGGFEERQIGVMQTIFEKPGARRETLLGRLG